MATTVGLRASIGQGTQAAVGVADKPSMQRAAVDPVADHDLVDAGVPVEHLADGLVALLNHRQLLHHGLPLDSAGPKSTGWKQ